MDELNHIAFPPRLEEIIARTNKLGFDMASEPRTGALLRKAASSKPGGRFLELGTGTGIATAWILDGMDAASRLVSVDVDGRVQDVARQILGNDERLELVQEDGLNFLRAQRPESFDFVFADAIPGKYEGLEDVCG